MTRVENKLLFMGGRITLINSVISALHLNWLSLYYRSRLTWPRHAIFPCPRARITWFIKPLELRTSELTQDTLKETLIELWNGLTNEQLAFFMTLAWHVWKARCKEMFQGKQDGPERIVQTALATNRFDTQALVGRSSISASALSNALTENEFQHQAWSDGSFESSGSSLYYHGAGSFNKIWTMWLPPGNLPFSHGTVVLLMAVQGAVELGIQQCVLKTDFKWLADMLHPSRRHRTIEAVDWRSYAELALRTGVNFEKPSTILL